MLVMALTTAGIVVVSLAAGFAIRSRLAGNRLPAASAAPRAWPRLSDRWGPPARALLRPERTVASFAADLKASETSSPTPGQSGRSVRPADMTPRLLGWLVAVCGLIDIVSAVVPRSVLAVGLLARIAPHVTSPAAHALIVPVGVLLLIASRGLVRRNQRAWRLAAGLLGLSVLLQVLRGPDYADAIVTGLVAVALLARREDFPLAGDPSAKPSVPLRLTGMLLLTLGYGMTALWAYQTAAGLPFSPSAALLDTLRAMGGQLPPDVDLLPGDFAEWFPLSVLSIAAIGVIWAAAVWVRPWRQRLFADPDGRERAADIVRRWGGDTLAPFALRSDKQWFVTGQTLIAYRVIRGIALISGDPVGPAENSGPALASFLAYASARGWHTAVMGASGRLLQVYRDQDSTRSTTGTRPSLTPQGSHSQAGGCGRSARLDTSCSARASAPGW